MQADMVRVTGAAAEPELAWLREGRPADEALTGYDRPGWGDSTWVLHRMYENPEAGPSDRDSVDEDEHVFAAPGPPWRRLRWSTYLARFPDFEPNRTVPPCFRWFPSWHNPASIRYPAPGCADEADLSDLADVLRLHLPEPDGPIHAFVADVPSVEWGSGGHLWRGPLHGIPGLVKDNGGPYWNTPSNVWPPDRSWFTWTDYDLDATKVCGSTELVRAVRNHPELETVEWSPGG